MGLAVMHVACCSFKIGNIKTFLLFFLLKNFLIEFCNKFYPKIFLSEKFAEVPKAPELKFFFQGHQKIYAQGKFFFRMKKKLSGAKIFSHIKMAPKKNVCPSVCLSPCQKCTKIKIQAFIFIGLIN